MYFYQYKHWHRRVVPLIVFVKNVSQTVASERNADHLSIGITRRSDKSCRPMHG